MIVFLQYNTLPRSSSFVDLNAFKLMFVARRNPQAFYVTYERFKEKSMGLQYFLINFIFFFFFLFFSFIFFPWE